MRKSGPELPSSLRQAIAELTRAVESPQHGQDAQPFNRIELLCQITKIQLVLLKQIIECTDDFLKNVQRDTKNGRKREALVKLSAWKNSLTPPIGSLCGAQKQIFSYLNLLKRIDALINEL